MPRIGGFGATSRMADVGLQQQSLDVEKAMAREAAKRRRQNLMMQMLGIGLEAPGKIAQVPLAMEGLAETRAAGQRAERETSLREKWEPYRAQTDRMVAERPEPWKKKAFVDTQLTHVGEKYAPLIKAPPKGRTVMDVERARKARELTALGEVPPPEDLRLAQELDEQVEVADAVEHAMAGLGLQGPDVSKGFFEPRLLESGDWAQKRAAARLAGIYAQLSSQSIPDELKDKIWAQALKGFQDAGYQEIPEIPAPAAEGPHLPGYPGEQLQKSHRALQELLRQIRESQPPRAGLSPELLEELLKSEGWVR